MDVLRHKSFGCSAVYDKDFLRRDESGGFGGEMGKDKRIVFYAKLAWMQPYSRVKGIEFIKLNGEIVARAIFYYRFLVPIPIQL